MDSDLFIDNVKVEKANAMMKYNRLKKIADLFRFFEICVVLILVSWFSTRLPVTFRVFSDYFRYICVVVVKPCFVFLVGNVIVLTLFLKSGQFGQSSTGNSSGTDLYDEYVKNSSNRDKIRSDISSSVPEINISPPISEVITVVEEEEISISSPAPETVVYEDKQIQSEEPKITNTNLDTTKHQTEKIYRRTQSENLKQHEKPKRDLRRTNTEKKSSREEEEEEANVENNVVEEEELSNEEFQRRIEAFIAKQVKFLKEESMAIVLQKSK